MTKNEKPIHPRKFEISRAAVTCFLERGYHQTGVRDIAKQAGISLGNLYNHFKGKAAVLAFIAEIDGKELNGFIENLTETADPRAALEGFIDDYAAYASRPENALLGAEILTEALRNETIAEVFGKDRRRMIDALAGCLGRGAKAGVFKPLSDETTVAWLILDALEAQGLRSLSNPAQGAATLQNIRRFLLGGGHALMRYLSRA